MGEGELGARADLAYRGGALAGSSDRADGPVLPDGYAAAAKAAAERRVVLAGYRLADALSVPLAEVDPKPRPREKLV